jgi:hypothetical protein
MWEGLRLIVIAQYGLHAGDSVEQELGQIVESIPIER